MAYSPRKGQTDKHFIDGWGIIIWLAYVFLVVRSVWVSDDALITMRVVENFVHGYGPVFNIGERVQAFTHPLWFLLLSALYAPLVYLGIDVPSQHIFFLTGVSLGISLLGAYLLLRWAWQTRHFLIVGAALLLSRGFIDYSTSGLEYPLLVLLLVLWFHEWQKGNGETRLQRLTVWFALLLTARMDAALLLLPLWVHEVIRGTSSWKQKVSQVVLGMLPFVVWEAFSFIYYGFFFPNTFYAKVGNAGLSLPRRFWQGAVYFLHTWDHDPVTLFMIGLVLLRSGRALVKKSFNRQPHLLGGLGLLFYLGYVLFVGGDFMQSRFFVPAFIWALLLWGVLPQMKDSATWILAGLLVALGYSAVYPTFRPQSVLATPPEVEEHLRFGYRRNGIADERIYHTFNLQGFALIQSRPGFPPLLHSRHQGVHWRYLADQRRILLVSSLGENGLVYGPSVHLVDRWALADPLLARLPAKERGQGLRVGHMTRLIPAGYLEALSTGDIERIADTNIRIYYSYLHKVIAAPLFSPQRWEAMWALHMGTVQPPEEYLYADDAELEQFLPGP